ncbi:hypothetical protein NT239_05945 [Chitinibacter sp. SCUT-21]|uniref:COG4648 family protein n=1 Tax=Chitinibacter sp. SCUT-21 TaxID=2970891 RepID=UPI0035A58C51
MKKALAILGALLALAYPLLVYLSLGHATSEAMAALLLAVALIRGVSSWSKPGIPLQVAILLVLAGILYSQKQPDLLRYYPVLINLAMLGVFASSLIRGPSLIERLARLSEPDLPPSGVIYTRRVTQVWCVFFIANGSIALWTALYASWENWTLYNGLIAYLLMGGLMAGEWILRRRIRKNKL